MKLKEHFRRNIQLAVPVMITQAGQIFVNVVDSVMVGKLGTDFDHVINPTLSKLSLAAVTLGNSVFMMMLVFAFGFSFALSPLIAAADAQKEEKEVRSYFVHSLVLNISLSVLLIIVLIFAKPLMFLLKQPQEVVEIAIPYISIMTYSMLPLMIFQTFRQFSEGLSLTIPITFATILGNILNVFLNYGWIYGNMGFPRLEVEGAAWGTFFSRIFMLLLLILVLSRFPKTKHYLSKLNFKKFSKHHFKQLYTIGIPTGLTSFFEVSAFAVASFLCGYTFLGTPEDFNLAKINLAAHQISINLVSTTFMLCTGIGVAATVRIGNQLGLKDYHTLREAGWSCILMVITFMTFCGIFFILLRVPLSEIYTNEENVISLASKLLVVGALFQLSDGLQLVILGALRGMRDVKIPSIISFISYWGITIPICAILAIYFEMRALGVWIGLGIGLTVAAVQLLFRYHQQTKKLIDSHKTKKINLN
ncbi:MATE family efflux transporter [Weeksella virosa]|uniref:Multidrug-efflux transporter n=1 Tax=Weeksella virosa (strain ATCC 43766 / DSM 16922 / JCM 21250 / CCUG 30538 / CDC 9751 / IAM 14551 / NBRC 16016 / NCTC 11634 / CL345/78) TaxID=865938 RepID=F0P0K8_WEEVC|nr:MATE family efflux transporter [Weeksella virosa]ADX68507.1 MATE efflux family protein [Weeksella virosa DSM 16922]MDK7675322.1 MATE family efflux transporter [Weeksella virosa]SUP54841.1 Na(+)/drug antiporter [Weeksella virosa]VEH63836.1 Na(+)/drug antiporter [Weeksella virosa]